jgi:hypothetical protein
LSPPQLKRRRKKSFAKKAKNAPKKRKRLLKSASDKTTRKPLKAKKRKSSLRKKSPVSPLTSPASSPCQASSQVVPVLASTSWLLANKTTKLPLRFSTSPVQVLLSLLAPLPSLASSPAAHPLRKRKSSTKKKKKLLKKN